MTLLGRISNYLARYTRHLEIAVSFFLFFALLPSLTSLSISFFQAVPTLSQYSGPINFLKIGAPFFLLFVLLKRKHFPFKLTIILLGAFALGTVSLVIAGIPCDFPRMLIREWGLTVLGTFAAISFLLLPRKNKLVILGAWTGTVYLATLSDAIAPGINDWLYLNVFSPETRAVELELAGRHVLSGVFSFQSLAKLLAWLPWILWFFALTEKPFPNLRVHLFFGAFTILSSATILATTQRGPFLAALLGGLVFVVHQAVRLKRKKAWMFGAGAIAVTVLLAFLLVPTGVLKLNKFRIFERIQDKGVSYVINSGNMGYRVRMNQLSLDTIATHPLGHACIPIEEFLSRDLYFSAHAHNVFLHQFRERGWLWGLFHLALWILALVGAWQLRTDAGSVMSGMLAVMIGTGMFDHLWTVLNHSILCSLALVIGLTTWFYSRYDWWKKPG